VALDPIAAGVVLKGQDPKRHVTVGEKDNG
jgi:hypothetical protein